jgi:hypothetical protein
MKHWSSYGAVSASCLSIAGMVGYLAARGFRAMSQYNERDKVWTSNNLGVSCLATGHLAMSAA